MKMTQAATEQSTFSTGDESIRPFHFKSSGADFANLRRRIGETKMAEEEKVGKSNSFAIDVKKGLSAEQKFLSSKYFYDDEGSRIFQQIMDLPEYYLTRTEAEIFSSRKK